MSIGVEEPKHGGGGMVGRKDPKGCDIRRT